MLSELKSDPVGGFIDSEGTSWESQLDYMFCHILPSCGCGDPALVGQYVLDVLKKCCVEGWEGLEFDGQTLFVLGWLTDKDYIEHGSSVTCSWLTSKGEQLVADLETVLKGEETQ